MQTPLPAPHGSASHSFTSEKDPGGEMSQGVGILGRPGATHSPALTHAVAVLRVRSVAGIAVTGVVRGARDALSVATDVLVQTALVCLWEAERGRRLSRGLSRERSLSATVPVPGQTSMPYSYDPDPRA